MRRWPYFCNPVRNGTLLMAFTASDLATLQTLMRDAAEREILPRFRHLAAGDIRRKTSAFDLVTDADEAAERAMTTALAGSFPGALVIGEEACEKDPALLDTLGGAELAFVLDPVDGTINFASGLPLYGVIAAVVARGEVVAGLIYDPIGGDWTIAMRGEGAWTQTREGARLPLRVAQPAALREMGGGVSWQNMPEPMRTHVTANLRKVAIGFSYRCAAHEYRLAAAGNCHFLLFHKLMPWDHAAGWLIHQEAGGYSACYDGAPYRPTMRDGGLLCAPDEASWRDLHAALLGDDFAL